MAHITAMATLAKQLKSNRIVAGTKIPHPCGDPNLPIDADRALRKEIVRAALEVLQANVTGPTVLVPDIAYTSG